MSTDLSSRLARYDQLIAAWKKRAQETPPPRAVDPGLEGIRTLHYPGGDVFCKETIYPVSEPFGDFSIDWSDCYTAPAGLPRFIADASGSMPGRWAFFDCETTGLSGGAGTMAFLIAVGRVVNDGFQIKQFFLPELADEQGLLQAVEESLTGVDVLWSYNGKCFDLPLIESRFRFWRMGFDREEYGLVDLLTPTRVLFKARIGDCSLGNLEERILKVARTEDLPGAEVPAVYFEYLQTGRSPRLHRVFEHNRVDVLSLAVYAAWLLNVFDPDCEAQLQYPEDVLSLARYYYRHREPEPAQVCLADTARFALGAELEAEYHRLAAYHFKRQRDYERAGEHFARLVEAPPADRVMALEELAKHLEHRRRDWPAALKMTDRAIAIVEQALAFGAQTDDPRLPSLFHRRARLKRKLAKTLSTE